MYICIYICIYMYTCIHMYICIYICILTQDAEAFSVKTQVSTP